MDLSDEKIMYIHYYLPLIVEGDKHISIGVIQEVKKAALGILVQMISMILWKSLAKQSIYYRFIRII